jgi:hypothetical protein
MRNKADGIEGRRLARSIAKISLATALMGAACWLSSFTVREQLGESSFARLIDVVVSLPLGLLVLYRACHWLQVHELIAARQAILERFRGPSRPRRAAGPYDRIDRNGF